jgi:hypothetical protein
VPLPRDANGLDSQTTVSADSDTKTFFRALANLQSQAPPYPKTRRPASEGTARGADRKRHVPGGTPQNYQSLSRLVESETARCVRRPGRHRDHHQEQRRVRRLRCTWPMPRWLPHAYRRHSYLFAEANAPTSWRTPSALTVHFRVIGGAFRGGSARRFPPPRR